MKKIYIQNDCNLCNKNNPDPELSVFFTQKIIPHMFEEGRLRVFIFTVVVKDSFFFLSNDL